MPELEGNGGASASLLRRTGPERLLGQEKLPRNVVFDVGNVLLSWDPRALLRDHLPSGSDHDQFMQTVFGHADWVELDRGTLDEEEAILAFSRRSGAALDLVRRLVHASKSSLTPMPESLALLEELYRLGTHLFCLTNMSHGTWEHVGPRFEFWKRFEGIVVSAQLHAVKPEPEIYRYLLEKWSLDPAQTLFFDDRAENVEGARAVGIEAYVFEGAARARAQLFGGSRSA